MPEHEPKLLPEITAIEIVDLRRIEPRMVSEYMTAAVNAPAVKCDGQRAVDIAKTWRALPEGFLIRCHTPPIGIRFFHDLQLICEASICWHCENIFGNYLDEPFSYCFDPKSAAGKELFNLIRELVGTEVLEEG